MTNNLWLVFLPSSLLAAIVGGLIAGLFGLRLKSNDYRNEYFKLVLQRRIEAYAELDKLIIMLKTCVLDNDRRPYHLLFSNDGDSDGVYRLLFVVMSKDLWFSDDLFDKLRDLNLLLFAHNPEKQSSLVSFGKEHYRRIAELRTQIERIRARDMLSLHHIARFLKSKKPRDFYEPIELQG